MEEVGSQGKVLKENNTIDFHFYPISNKQTKTVLNGCYPIRESLQEVINGDSLEVFPAFKETFCSSQREILRAGNNQFVGL